MHNYIIYTICIYMSCRVEPLTQSQEWIPVAVKTGEASKGRLSEVVERIGKKGRSKAQIKGIHVSHDSSG